MSHTQSLNSEDYCGPFACLPSQGKQTSGNSTVSSSLQGAMAEG